MLLNIPFYPNTTGDGQQCCQICMKDVLEYFLHKEFSLEELDKLTHRNENKWTWTTQLVPPLFDLGLNVKYFSKDDPSIFLEGENSIREYFEKDAETILHHTDILILIDSIKNCSKYNLFEKKVLSVREIEEYISQGSVPLMLIDLNILNGKGGSFLGHMVPLTGFDEDNFYYHESGSNNPPETPEPNKKVAKDLLLRAWDNPSTGNDVVIVFGKR